jgi:hypothetical protein
MGQFEALSAESDATIEPNTDFEDLPNQSMTHPIIFKMLGGSGEIPAKTAWYMIIEALQEIENDAGSNKAAKIAIFMEGSHLTLSYIWRVTAKNLTKPITLSNPPKSETVDKEGMALLEQLKGERCNQGNGQGSNKRGGRKKKSKKSSKECKIKIKLVRRRKSL